MPRLFTGLEIPADIGFALSLKRGGLTGARWIDPENYHITLRFIGDVDGNVANEVVDSLDRLSNSLQFSIRLTHLGSFGGDKPRALYAGVEPSEALNRLQAAQERMLQKAGLPPEGRKFVPHVSLARLRGTSAEPPPPLRARFPDLVAEVPPSFRRPIQGLLPTYRLGWGVIRPSTATTK